MTRNKKQKTKEGNWNFIGNIVQDMVMKISWFFTWKTWKRTQNAI